jgi:hypothetical protein
LLDDETLAKNSLKLNKFIEDNYERIENPLLEVSVAVLAIFDILFSV